MAISVLNVRSVRNGTRFPSNDYEEPFGTIEDSVFLPAPTLRESSRDGIVKILFFSYKHLDDLLAPFFSARYPSRLLNSRLVSAALEGAGPAPAAPVRVSFQHLRQESVGRPACVTWDRDEAAWTEAGCSVVRTNRSATECECAQLSTYALLMEEDLGPTLVHIPDFHVEIIAASVAVGLILIILIVALKVDRCINILAN